MEVVDIAYHRNGIAAEGFHVVKFLDHADMMVAIVFDTPGHVAVFNQCLLGIGTIAFGENSWRGDVYEDALRRAIEERYGDKEDDEA